MSAAKLVWIFAACLQPGILAQDGVRGALAQVPVTSPLFGQKVAIAHLDSDESADGAVLIDTTPGRVGGPYRLELHLTARTNDSIAFESADSPNTVSALDVDNDSDTDLVVSPGADQPGLRVWLNDGRGLFREGAISDYPQLRHPSPVKLRHARPRSDRSGVVLPRARPTGDGIGQSAQIYQDPLKDTLFSHSSTRGPRPGVHLLTAQRGPPSSSL